MTRMPQLRSFDGRVVMVGFGSVGQGTLPVLLERYGLRPDQVTILRKGLGGAAIARAFGVEARDQPLTPANHEALLAPLLADGDFLLNLSVDVSSLDLVRFCAPRGVLYLDACNEPWPGRYDNPALSPAQRSNYALREELLAFRATHPLGPTACITQGANPGIVSSFVKMALLRMTAELQRPVPEPPGTREGWARLARSLDVRVIHIAERDTQVARERKRRDEFVNTWSVEGFIDEGLQPAELGWGSHERHWPADAVRHEGGCGAAILLERPGMDTHVRSWTPLQGPFHGFLITHSEAISIADFLTVREGGPLAYRPTVHYAYHPCDDAVASVHELAGREWQRQSHQRIICDEIVEGMDELGVLLMGNPRGVYWYGSRLAVEQARAIAPHNNATSLQVVAGILGAMTWALDHPRAGVVEADDIDVRAMMDVASPYLGELVGVWGHWTPLQGRSRLFGEPADLLDPWQFLNFRVA